MFYLPKIQTIVRTSPRHTVLPAAVPVGTMVNVGAPSVAYSPASRR
jgi:hypothetical protein